MQEFFRFVGPALGAALLMSPVHALFGLHIVRRGLIFIDLAVAQVAALGVSFAIAFGNEPDSTAAYRYAVGFALGGALLISLTRFRLGRVPHEAIIGMVYVLATAASIVILTFAPSGHGLEEIQAMLSGNILFVQDKDVRSTAFTYGVILVLLVALWRPISAVTFNKDGLSKPKVMAIDFAFYALLGFVVASSVKVAGVLVVFSWLVMPAIVAFFFVDKMWLAAMIAIPLGMLGSFGGLLVSFFAKPLEFQAHAHEHFGELESAGEQGWPTGPSIVVAMGAAVLIAYLVKVFIPDRSDDPELPDSAPS